MLFAFPAKYRPGHVGARRCAVLAAGLIGAIFGLHAYWALGGSWAAETLNGGNDLGAGDVWSMAVSAPVSALLATLATVVAMRRGDEMLVRAHRHIPRRV